MAKAVAGIQRVCDMINGDLNEMETAAQGFGGPSDMAMRNNNTLLATVKKKAH